MMIPMRASFDWLSGGVNAALEERASLADWQLFIGSQNVCLHLDGNVCVDHITSPLYAIAEGLAHDWWKLFGGRDDYVSFVNYRMGFAVPDVRMHFDGAAFEVSALQKTYRNPDVRFWTGPSEVMARGDAELALTNFIQAVVAKLNEDGVEGTSAQLRWARVQASRADAEEASFCEAAGALKLDPYNVGEQQAGVIERAASVFSGESLLEFLSGIGCGNFERASTILDWVSHVEDRPGYLSRLPHLRDLVRRAERDPAALEVWPAYCLGYRKARAARGLLDMPSREKVRSYTDLATRLGAPKFRLAQNVDGVAALRTDQADGIHVHLRSQGKPSAARIGHAFAFSRALGDAICFPQEGRAIINELRDAYRQAAGRAFAAEFLAPVEEVVALRMQGYDHVSIASDFGVGATLIERQLENVERIRAACC